MEHRFFVWIFLLQGLRGPCVSWMWLAGWVCLQLFQLYISCPPVVSHTIINFTEKPCRLRCILCRDRCTLWSLFAYLLSWQMFFLCLIFFPFAVIFFLRFLRSSHLHFSMRFYFICWKNEVGNKLICVNYHLSLLIKLYRKEIWSECSLLSIPNESCRIRRDF